MTLPTRLGDILIRKKQIAPHQLGVALAVQRKSRLPLGQILLQTAIISRAQLAIALLQQKLARAIGARPRKAAYYGQELVNWGRNLLESHVKENVSPAEKPAASHEDMTLRLRSELAGLPGNRAGRIIEDDAALKERLLTGNF